MLCPQNMSLGPRLPESSVWHVLKREKGLLLLLMMMMMDDDEGCWMMAMVMVLAMAIVTVMVMVMVMVTVICQSLVGIQKRSDSSVSARGRHGAR